MSFWTPYTIKMVLHFHSQPFEAFPNSQTDLFKTTLKELCDLGLIHKVSEEGNYVTSELGNALVQMWLETPIPVQKFVDPRFE